MVFTSFSAKQAIRLTLVVVAAASLASCKTPPKAGPTTPTGPSTPGTQTGPTTPGGREPVAQGPLPGSAQDFVVNVGDRVYFDYDSYAIRDDARPVLEGQAAWLMRYPSVQVRIEGNADERGTREYNLALGARRANSVREFLTGRGVQAGRIATISNGKERPVDPGTSEDAYQRNRNGQTVVTGGAR